MYRYILSNDEASHEAYRFLGTISAKEVDRAVQEAGYFCRIEMGDTDRKIGTQIAKRIHIVTDANSFVLDYGDYLVIQELPNGEKVLYSMTSAAFEEAFDIESNLVRHARTELAMVGNGPEIDEPLIEMVRIFSEMGHSGSSAFYTVQVLERLLRFENLYPLTDNPEEWQFHGEDISGSKDGIWQNRRNGSAFSTDGGKTYYLIGDKDEILTSHDHTKKYEPDYETEEE